MIVGLLYLTAGAAVTLVTFVLSLTDSKAIFLLTIAALWWQLFWLRYLRRAWPTGIWVNETGSGSATHARCRTRPVTARRCSPAHGPRSAGWS
jgi:hypothetical protein